MEQEKEFKHRITALQAGKILMQQKLYEEEKKKKELEETERKFDQKRALEIFKDVKRLISRNELFSPEMEKSLWQVLSPKYQGPALRLLLSNMIDEYTQLKREENPQDILPPLVRFKAKNEEYYIHRNSIVQAFLQYVEKIKKELEDDYISTWAELLRQGNSEFAMKFDEFFTKDVQKKIHQNYVDFALLLSEPQLVMNGIFYSSLTQKERGEFLSRFFVRPAEPIFKPYHAILDLDRKTIYSKAKASLPLSYRFFLLKWLLWLFKIFQRSQKPQRDSLKKSEGKQNLTPLGNSQEAAIEEIEKLKSQYLESGDIEAEILRLEETWNIKLGEVREILIEKIQREVKERVRRIYHYLQKIRTNRENYLKKELENLADFMVSKAQEDVADKKAYRKYIILLSLRELSYL